MKIQFLLLIASETARLRAATWLLEGDAYTRNDVLIGYTPDVHFRYQHSD
jgi:hypothetical protein